MGCLGDTEGHPLFQTKGFLEELKSEMSFEEWIEVGKKQRKSGGGGRERFCAKEKLWKGDRGKGVFQGLCEVLCY